MIDLTYIFGNEICVDDGIRQIDRQYVGLPGSHGLLSMHMGSRGKQIIVTGQIWGYGGDYAYARAECRAWRDVIELYQYADPATYTFMDDTYENVVFDKIIPVPDSNGKTYHLIGGVGGVYVTMRFVAYLRQLI